MGHESRRADLKKQIASAFASAPYPGDDRLVTDDSPEHLECREIATALRGRRWHDIPLEILRENHQSFAFFTTEAVRYFLPAYLLASIEHYEGSWNIPDSLFFHLTPQPEGSAGQARYQALWAALSGPQKGAIRAFMEYMRDMHGEDDDWAQACQQLPEG